MKEREQKRAQVPGQPAAVRPENPAERPCQSVADEPTAGERRADGALPKGGSTPEGEGEDLPGDEGFEEGLEDEDEDEDDEGEPLFQTRIFIEKDGSVVFENLSEEMLELVQALDPEALVACVAPGGAQQACSGLPGAGAPPPEHPPDGEPQPELHLEPGDDDPGRHD